MAFSPSNLVQNILGKNTSKTVKINVIGSNSLPISNYFVNGKDFDCIVSSNTNLTNRIAVNPIEFGTSVTDNIIQNPNVFILSGVVSPYQSFLGGIIQFGAPLLNLTGIPSLSSQNNAQQWYEGFRELRELKFGGLITLTIYPVEYKNLAVQSISYRDTSTIGEGIQFTLILKEIIVATTSIIDTKILDNVLEAANAILLKVGSITSRSALANSIFSTTAKAISSVLGF